MLFTLIYTKKIIENDIIFLQSQLQTKKLLLQEIKTKIDENCNHTWITDLIDIDPDTSKTIIYCEHCEKSKPI
jgi:hypothetical protein